MPKRRRREHTPLLDAQRADEIAFLRERGLDVATSLRLKPRIVTEGIAIVVDLLGEDWLRGELARAVPALRGAASGHRIVQAFKTGDENALMTVLELGLYVKHLSKCEGFADIVPALRDSYKSTLLQLACAYRINLRGPRVALEPKSAGGRLADIAFRWSGRNYMVECYTRPEQRDPIQDVLDFSLRRIGEEEPWRTRRLRIRLRLTKVPTDAERLDLEREACRLVNAVGAGPTLESGVAAAHLGVDVLEGDVEPDLGPGGVPLDSGPYGDHDLLVASAQVSEKELLRPLKPLDDRSRGSRFVIWRPPGREVRREERISRFTDRIEQKLAQARPEQGSARRIVVAQLLDGDANATRDQRLLRHVHGRFARNHADVGAVIICARVTQPDHRPAYVGTIIPGRTHDPIFDAWPRWALDTDYKRDVFADWDGRL